MAAEERSQNANLDIAEGRAALDRGDLEEAAAKFRHALQLQPGSSEAQRYLEKLTSTKATPDDPTRLAELEKYIREGKFTDVEPLLAEYVKQRPNSSWGWYALGYSLFAQQKIGESIKALAKSLELDIKNAEAHKILGRNLMIIGRFDAARVEFEQGIRYKPDSAELHYNLGKLFSIQDDWESARKAFDEALRIDPSYIEALDALGFALEALGDDDGAVRTYRKAIALNEERRGSFASPQVNLSAYYNRTGNPERALEHAGKALELEPEVRPGVVSKGEGVRATGETRRCGRCVEPGDLVQSAGVVVLLRAGRCVPAPGLDGRKPKGAGDVQAPRSGNQRTRQEAAQRRQSRSKSSAAGPES